MNKLCVNLPLSLVATSVPLAELPKGVRATSALMFKNASLPHGDQTLVGTSLCLEYLPAKGPLIDRAVET